MAASRYKSCMEPREEPPSCRPSCAAPLATALCVALLAGACSRGTQEIGHARVSRTKAVDAAAPGAAENALLDGGADDARAAEAGTAAPHSDAAVPEAPSCAKATYAAALKALDMFILLDQSGS